MKSPVRSMSDEDLVQAVQPGLTAVGPFTFHVCNIFSLHVQFLICMCDPSGPPYFLSAEVTYSLQDSASTTTNSTVAISLKFLM